MILKWLIQVQEITDMFARSYPDIKEIYLESGNWKIIKELINILKLFYKATSVFSCDLQPLYRGIRIIIHGLLSHLDQHLTVRGVREMKDRLRDYLFYLLNSSSVPVLLNPSVKFETFDDGNQELNSNELRVIYLQYTLNHLVAKSKKIEDLLNFFRKLITSEKNKEVPESEPDSYLTLPKKSKINTLMW